MKDQSEKVKRGSTVTVRLTADRKTADQAAKPRRGALPDDADDDLYTFRKGIQFFDLATRKNDDGTYSDTTPGHLVSPIIHADVWNYYHGTLLNGFDPAKCLRIPQGSQYLYFDASFVAPDADAERNLIGRPGTRPYVAELVSGPVASQAKWSGGRLPYGSKNPYLSIESAFYYNAFITQDDGLPEEVLPHPFYMVTAEPDDQADNVPFALAATDRVYLTPVRTLFSTGTSPNHLYYGRRLPVLQGFAPQSDGLAITGEAFDFFMDATVTSAVASAGLWTAAAAWYLATFPGAFWENVLTRGGILDAFHPSYTVDEFCREYSSPPRSWLAAVVVRGKDRFYVWRNYTAGFAGFLYAPQPVVFRRRSKIYQPA